MRIEKLLNRKRSLPRSISGKSLVEPSQELTIKQIVEQFTNGERPNAKVYEVSFGEEYQDIDLDMLDPLDRLAIQQEFEKRYNNALRRKKEQEEFVKAFSNENDVGETADAKE